MEATDTTQSPAPVDPRAVDAPTNHRLGLAAARLAVAAGVGGTTLVALAEVAHARIALNHNESPGRDRPRRTARRAAAALALATALSLPAAAAAAPQQPTRAGTCPPWLCGAGNHNESPGRERP